MVSSDARFKNSAQTAMPYSSTRRSYTAEKSSTKESSSMQCSLHQKIPETTFVTRHHSLKHQVSIMMLLFCFMLVTKKTDGGSLAKKPPS